MAKNVYCIERDTKGIWRRVRVSGGRKPVFSTPEIMEGALFPAEFCEAYVSFDTSQYSIFREFFPNLKGELLDIQIKEKVKSQVFWADISDIKITWKKLTEKEKRTELSIIACPFRELNDIVEQSKIRKVKIRKISHFAIAVSSLVSLVSEEPVLALVFNEGALQIIGVHEKVPFFHQIIPMEMDFLFDKAIVTQGIDMAKASIKRMYNIDIKGFITFGEYYTELDEILQGNEIINPEWKDIMSFEDVTYVKKYPSLFGSYFIDSSFNMLPKSIYNYYLADDAVNYSYYFTVFASVILMFFIYKSYSENTLLKKNYKDLSTKISTQSNILSAKFPDTNEKNSIEMFINIFEKYKEQHRLDNILLDISKCLTPNVVVKSLSMNLLSNPGVTPGYAQQASFSVNDIQTNLGQSYVINVSIAKKGDYFNTMNELQNVKKNLSRIFIVENTQAFYDENNLEGNLSCVLKSKK